ncbi:hypothetical protein GGI42DRAFT_337811 [Trichoderma sp. SZMC 28013]
MAEKVYRHKCIQCRKPRSDSFHTSHPAGPGHAKIKGTCRQCRAQNTPRIKIYFVFLNRNTITPVVNESFCSPAGVGEQHTSISPTRDAHELPTHNNKIYELAGRSTPIYELRGDCTEDYYCSLNLY